MRPTRLRLAVLLAAAILAGCAAERVHRDGLDALEHGDYEAGIAKLEQAVREAPDNLTYRLDLRARKEAAVQQLIAAADSARGAGKPELAETSYHRVLVLEPGNDRARKGLEGVQADQRHAARTAKADKLLTAQQLDAAEAEVRAVLAEDPGYAPAAAVPHLRTHDNHPVSLQFRDAPTKMVFEVLARQTGINFIFDKDVKSDGKTTIFVSQVAVEQAIDLILAQNQLARQVLSDNMVLVYPSTPAKQKDYQDEIVRTFYLANAAPKEAESMIKTVLGAKTLFIDERSSVLVMRDTPEHVRMAEKLVAALDVPESEVIMEVEVLEITRNVMDQLGINYPSSVSLAMTSASGAKDLLLSDLHKQNSGTITVSPLSVSVDALKTTGLTNVLSSPRIRARNKEKAKILIGDRVPVITSGTSATTGGSYSTSSVQYIEVGLTLEVQPTIHGDGNVAIKVGLEVSSILKTINVPIGNGGSTLAYQIGTRNANTLLELKDGETQVLAGLISDSDQRNSTHIPGLGDLPILGRLFGSTGTTRDKSEIVLSITPRIIRAQARPSSETTEFWYGTESQTRSAPLSTSTPSAAGPTAAAGPVTPGGVSFGSGGTSAPGGAASYAGGPHAAPTRIESAVAAPAVAEAAATGATAAGAAATGAAASGSASGAAVGTGAAASGAAQEEAKAAVPKAAPAAAGSGKPTVTIDGPSSAKVGEEISVAVKLASAEPLGRVRAQVRFDASALQLVSAEPGDLAPSGDAPKVELKPGGVQLELTGSTDAPVAGGGSIVNMRFRVVVARPGLSIATQVVLIGADGVAVASTPATPLNITVSQ
jgi:general secretion pathway protein D